MNIKKLINDLARITQPDRQADRAIAHAIGMEEVLSDGKSYWILDGFRYNRFPAFTSSVDMAFIAVKSVGADMGAFTSEGAMSKAAFDGDNIIVAATPAIALCMAALQKKLSENAG